MLCLGVYLNNVSGILGFDLCHLKYNLIEWNMCMHFFV